MADPPSSTPSVSWTVSQWVQWREQQIRYILQPTFQVEGEALLSRDEVITRAARAYALVEPLMTSDPLYFSNASRRGRAMANFISFIKAQHWMALRDAAETTTNALGLSIPDVDYVAYVAADTSFPDLLKTQEFLQAVGDPATYKAAVEIIERHNLNVPNERKWTVLLFKGQFIKSVDQTTYGRMLVLVPNVPAPNGDLIDKWIMYAILTPDQMPRPHVRRPVPQAKSVSLVAIHRNPKTPRHTKAYLVDFMRKRADVDTINITPTALLAPGLSKNCYECHKAAVIPIRPQIEYAFDSGGRLIPKTSGVGDAPAALNRLIRSYGPPAFAHQEPKAYGPSLGPEDVERTDQFIRTAAAELPLSPESFERIKSAMKCAECHDAFAPINYPLAVRTDKDIKAFKSGQGLLQTYIEKGYMPPNNDLTDTERRVLWRCLVKEYLDLSHRSGVFTQWLRGTGAER